MAQIPSRCHGLNPQRVFRRRELPVQTYEEPDAYVGNTTDSRTGIAPKVPPQFWRPRFNRWLATVRHHNIGCRQAWPFAQKRIDRSRFILEVNVWQCPTPRSGSWPRPFQGPYFVGGIKSCVSLAIPPAVSHISRPEWTRELVRAFRLIWPICQLNAQKRLLASWAGSIDLTDLPDVGAAEFLTALIDEQRQHYQQLPNDEERLAHQAARREQTK